MNAGSFADSAGTPWAGRSLSGTGFDDDGGGADPELVAAVAETRQWPSAEADARLVRAAAAARLLVPVVAVLGEEDDGAHGHTVDERTDMAVVTLTAPDGRRALPVFTSVAALAAWGPSARPVPVSAARAAQAAVAEGCQVAVVDVGGPAPTELRPSMLWALAQEVEWRPAHADPFVAQSVSRAVVDEADVVTHRVEEGQPPGRGVLRVVLGLRAGMPAEAVQALATRVGERLATDGEFRARVDELTFTVEAGTT
ncbi:MAG: SseB family protein [Lapillicoccus sp.]